MAIILTSFKKSANYRGECYSVARFQPKGFDYPALSFLAAEGPSGNKLLIENFKSAQEFEEALKLGYQKRWAEIKVWLDWLDRDKEIVLCCWCPYSKDTQAQMKQTGSFWCHTGLIGQMLQKHRPDIEIVLDNDRLKHLLPRWMPIVVGVESKRPQLSLLEGH